MFFSEKPSFPSCFYQITYHTVMLKSRSGDLKEGESIGGFLIKIVVALIGIIILVTVVPDVLGVDVAGLCIKDTGLLSGTTAKHCGDGSAILTDTVKDIFADGYNFILIAVAVGLIAYGAVKSVQYRIEPSLVIADKKK
ncbi:MAG: hypothetical protein KC483_09100 [Nitrosarchaeum sp.]|nr:hypothetical protein [Nitrosarchaeum sp.]